VCWQEASNSGGLNLDMVLSSLAQGRLPGDCPTVLIYTSHAGSMATTCCVVEGAVASESQQHHNEHTPKGNLARHLA